MDIGQRQHHSHLFTLRLWAEDLGDGRSEWRGQVRHVISGEAHYFREWSHLIALLRAMLPNDEINATSEEMNATDAERGSATTNEDRTGGPP